VRTLEDRYGEAEAAEEARRRAKLRRQPIILLLVVNTLLLGTALTAMVDLRRLQTPGGTALTWTQAAVFGVCDDYLHYSVADVSRPDERTPDELCRDLRASTAQARTDSLKIGLRLSRVRLQDHGAEVDIVLTRSSQPVRVALRLLKIDGRWRVVRDQDTCASIGCA
jgi:hypothetical protein